MQGVSEIRHVTVWGAGVFSFRCLVMAVMALISVNYVAAGEYLGPTQIRVIDGDSIEVAGQNIRLVGYDTPETYRPKCDYERAHGTAAAQRLSDLIASGQPIELVILPGKDKYRRGLGRLFVGQQDVAEILISEQLARPYDGGKRTGWCQPES